MARQPKLLDETALRDYAVKALARRARSVGELRRLLARRAAQPAYVDGVVRQLKEYGFLDDEKFAQAYASWRIENQRLGPRRVERDLRAHWVAPKVAQRVVEKAYREVSETQLLRTHLERRLRHKGPPKDQRGVASLYRHLIGAGFSPGAILPELRRLAKGDADWMEALAEEE